MKGISKKENVLLEKKSPKAKIKLKGNQYKPNCIGPKAVAIRLD